MNKQLHSFINFAAKHNRINDKRKLIALAQESFNFTKDRTVYYESGFAVRFSESKKSGAFSNTVLSLSKLQKYDDMPFIVCLVTPDENALFLANSTFLKKISHSSQELRANNIRGSFNGSDIMRDFEGISNSPQNFERLYKIHHAISFNENLLRLVESTNNISPVGQKYLADDSAIETIMNAPKRATDFIKSNDVLELKKELDEKVNNYRNEILLASLIENVNIRGRVIEYLIAGEDDRLRQELISALRNNDVGLPKFKTDNSLGDYSRVFDLFLTETDIKTKIMILDSNPKAYNLDKMLEFLSTPRSVFMFYFVGVDPERIVNTVLVSMFQTTLLNSTILLKHWAGRNSRGVSQFEGKAIGNLIMTPASDINIDAARTFLKNIIAL